MDSCIPRAVLLNQCRPFCFMRPCTRQTVLGHATRLPPHRTHPWAGTGLDSFGVSAQCSRQCAPNRTLIKIPWTGAPAPHQPRDLNKPAADKGHSNLGLLPTPYCHRFVEPACPVKRPYARLARKSLHPL